MKWKKWILVIVHEGIIPLVPANFIMMVRWAFVKGKLQAIFPSYAGTKSTTINHDYGSTIYLEKTENLINLSTA